MTGDGGDPDAASGASDPEDPGTRVVDVGDREAFDAMLDAERVVLAYFHADWCGPCETLTPTVERVARDLGVALAKVDADEHPHLGSRFGVHSVPVLRVYVDGHRVAERHGSAAESTVRDLVRPHLGDEGT